MMQATLVSCHVTERSALMAEYDFTGLKCPLPVLKARRALKEAAAGAVLVFFADDPAAPLDFEHFCETSGHKLVNQERHEKCFVFTVQKQG